MLGIEEAGEAGMLIILTRPLPFRARSRPIERGGNLPAVPGVRCHTSPDNSRAIDCPLDITGHVPGDPHRNRGPVEGSDSLPMTRKNEKRCDFPVDIVTSMTSIASAPCSQQ